MKILFVASGRSFHASRWANELAKRGYEVHYFSVVDIERPMSGLVKIYRLKFNFGKLSYLFGIPRLRRLIATIKPDIVHAHYSSGNGFLAAASLIGFDIAFITSLYGAEVFDFPAKSILHKKLLKFVCSRANVVLSTSIVMAKKYNEVYQDLAPPVVTSFGVDIEKFCPVSKPPETEASVKIGMVKKIEKKYGIDTFVQAAEIVIRTSPNKKFEFSIVGDGSQRKNIEKLVDTLKIGSYISLIGWMPNKEVPVYLQSLDIFVVSSRHESESFGVAAVEAQSCGIPVIVSNVGGLPEVVADNVSGIVIPKDSPEVLAEAILELAGNASVRMKMGLSGRARVIENYDWKSSVDKMERVYRDVNRV